MYILCQQPKLDLSRVYLSFKKSAWRKTRLTKVYLHIVRSDFSNWLLQFFVFIKQHLEQAKHEQLKQAKALIN